MRNWLKNVGPGVLVSAAFIGPGTVTVCTLAGVNFQFALLWALLLSVLACIILQEMAARLGLISQAGLSESIRKEIQHPILKGLAIALAFSSSSLVKVESTSFLESVERVSGVIKSLAEGVIITLTCAPAFMNNLTKEAVL